MSSAANGTCLIPVSPRTSEGNDSNLSTPTFGGLAGIEESPRLEEAEHPREANTPSTKSAENDNIGGKVISEVQACILLQRWWKKHREKQQEIFEDLVVGLMALRREAALEVQRAWRKLQRQRALGAAAR